MINPRCISITIAQVWKRGGRDHRDTTLPAGIGRAGRVSSRIGSLELWDVTIGHASFTSSSFLPEGVASLF